MHVLEWQQEEEHGLPGMHSNGPRMNGGRQAGHLQEILEHGLGSIWVEIHHVLVCFFQGSYQWFFGASYFPC